MILVHEKGAMDPYGAQRAIVTYIASQKLGRAGQPEITAHVLATCQCHAIGQLENLRNQGAIDTIQDNPSMFKLTEAGREWCQEQGIGRKHKPVQDAQEDHQDDSSEAEPKPRKRGRPRREAPAPE